MLALPLLNIAYQVYKKPTEVFRPFESLLIKSPLETWKSYSEDFKRFSTFRTPASFLAALAQVESAGNPWANSFWKFRWTTRWDQIFSPASTAVGLLQITEPTLKEAKEFCFVEGKIHRSKNCEQRWLSRLSARDSIELTSARMNYYLRRITKKNTSKRNYEKLASVLHLCGLKKARLFTRMNFRFAVIGRCGLHRPQRYYQKISQMKYRFERIEADKDRLIK